MILKAVIICLSIQDQQPSSFPSSSCCSPAAGSLKADRHRHHSREPQVMFAKDLPGTKGLQQWCPLLSCLCNSNKSTWGCRALLPVCYPNSLPCRVAEQRHFHPVNKEFPGILLTPISALLPSWQSRTSVMDDPTRVPDTSDEQTSNRLFQWAETDSSNLPLSHSV